jgi:hypothetical protein
MADKETILKFLKSNKEIFRCFFISGALRCDGADMLVLKIQCKTKQHYDAKRLEIIDRAFEEQYADLIKEMK